MVKQQAVEHAVTFLQELPEKPKEDLSLKEAVESLRDPIKSALAKGYSYQDLADLLSEKGIKISALTLKNYVPSGKRQSAKTKGRKPRKAQDTESVPAEATKTEVPAAKPAETEAPPIKPRRGRAKGAIAAKAQTGRQTRATQADTKTASSKSASKAPSTRRRQASA